jgi:hypothetical protein
VALTLALALIVSVGTSLVVLCKPCVDSPGVDRRSVRLRSVIHVHAAGAMVRREGVNKARGVEIQGQDWVEKMKDSERGNG